MRIAVGSDERTYVTDALVEDLRRRGHEPTLVGPLAGGGDAWRAGEGARRWNHANVLALSPRTTTTGLAEEILDAWFAAPTPDQERTHVDAVESRPVSDWRSG